jgi:type II secretory pathway component PulM
MQIIVPYAVQMPTAGGWFAVAQSIGAVVLGTSIAVVDSRRKGESLALDYMRSMDAALFTALLFGAPAAVVMHTSTGVTQPMLALLLLLIVLAVVLQTFNNPIQAAVDLVALRAFPQLRQERAELRTAADELPKVDAAFDRHRLSEEEFTKLTRRALSYLGDLSRLTSSPLTRLPQVDVYLAQNQMGSSSLERATALKAILTVAIRQLKPDEPVEFDTSDSWRHYNALYFPYVIGLRPYSRRAEHVDLDSAAEQALEWFRIYVPERTLYNWQNGAAKLIAQHLLERPGQ